MEGTVAKLNVKPWNDIKFYSILIEEDNKWYSCGANNPGVSVGQKVSFETYQKGKYTHIQDGTLKILGHAPASGSDVGRAFNREDYWQNREAREGERQARIEAQSARKDAIAFLNLANDVEALPIPKSKKPGEKFDLLLGLVETVAKEFLGESAERAEADDEEDVPQ